MQQVHLTSAALALSKILTFARIPHGFFGGFAILSLTAPAYPSAATCPRSRPHRETKDLDVLVSASKSDVTELLQGRPEWLLIPQGRDDYVAFFYKCPFTPSGRRSSADSCASSISNYDDTDAVVGVNGDCIDLDSDFEDEDQAPAPMVLVELFVTPPSTSAIPRSKFPPTTPILLPRTNSHGTSYIPILREEYLLRGKLAAAASGRGKMGDAVDIILLIEKCGNRLKGRMEQMGFGEEVGLDGRTRDGRRAKRRGSIEEGIVEAAIQRWPGIRASLEEVGVCIAETGAAAGKRTKSGGRMGKVREWVRRGSREQQEEEEQAAREAQRAAERGRAKRAGAWDVHRGLGWRGAF